MELDRKMNLVIALDTDRGEAFVHSTPLSREVFEKYFYVIAQTYARIMKGEMDVVAGPRIAALMLKRTAEDLGVWGGAGGVEMGLMAEIRRLTNVILPAPTGGWATTTFQEVVDGKILPQEDLDEVEGAIAFFICASAMHNRRQRAQILRGMIGIWGFLLTSSNCTAYASSLQTSTETASSGATEAGSSVPS